MDDTSSVVGVCITLQDNLSLLLTDLQCSLVRIRNAEPGLRNLPSELASLHLTVGALQSSFRRTPDLSVTLRMNLKSVMTGCSRVVQAMRNVLVEETASHLDAEFSGVRRLLPDLEAHRSAIQLALELLLVTTLEPSPSSGTSRLDPPSTASQSQSTDQVLFMLREIRVLQFRVAQLAQASNPSGIPLQRFLDNVSDYADSAFQDADSNSSRLGIARETDADSDVDDFCSARESFMDPSSPSSQIDSEAGPGFELLPTNTAPRTRPLAFNSPVSQPMMPPALLPSTSSLSAHSSWTYTSIRLRISNRLYSFRTASDTTRNILSALTFLDPALRAVRLARVQGVLPLAPSQKAWVDEQIAFAESSMDHAAVLVEPARVELETRADVRFRRKVRFVLRDSPRIHACWEQLSAAGAGLNAAANLLYGPRPVGDGDNDSIATADIPAPPYSLSLRGGFY